MARMITGNLRVIFFLAVLITSELELVHGYFSPENRNFPRKEVSGIKQSGARLVLQSKTRTATPYSDTIRKSQDISTRRLLLIILPPSLLLLLAVPVFLYWICKSQIWRCADNTQLMPIWTNQATLQHHLDNELSKSPRSSGFGTWLGQLQSLNGCGRGGEQALLPPCSLAYSLLQSATDNFSFSNLLGVGRLGHIYKAKLDYGIFVTVRRVEEEEKISGVNFQVEVDLISKIQHPNLMPLLGYSCDGPQHLLVHGLMQNGSLHDQLHGPSHGSMLNWQLRLKIALEAARGLEHLHEHSKVPIIHGNFKASNILLGSQFNAKVSDFGFKLAAPESSLLDDNRKQVPGACGYMAPEYLMDGILTEKSDVYGFGVVLLELLTGRPPVDSTKAQGSQCLVTWATQFLTDRKKTLEILDPCLGETVNFKHLYQVAAVTVLCVQSEASYRPLIADVVQSLVPLVPQELGGALRQDPEHSI
ncbi:unnamed protein product [Sphagnum troendelagicum]|uniref:Protein kinase domain-containing protein n=1 Tax=Sphagnum troendelagicum TaxID=128251 RepID=A0ABP0UYE0_9BRYO